MSVSVTEAHSGRRVTSASSRSSDAGAGRWLEAIAVAAIDPGNGFDPTLVRLAEQAVV